MHETSGLLTFAHTLHWYALGFMGLVYTIRIIWFVRRFKAGGERQASTGIPGRTSPSKGILYSWGNVVMPWGMESTRTKPFFYLQFVAFHLGVTSAIALLFLIPWTPGWLENQLFVLALQIPIGAAFLVGLGRIYRRFRDPYIRAISSPDDFFSVFLLTVWFFFSFLAVPNSTANGEWHMLGYFFLASFFLVYVPFSKISHYLYYPFTRYYLGKSLGHRGVFPILRGPVHGKA
jgi:nitrate reductase gamma subunit